MSDPLLAMRSGLRLARAKLSADVTAQRLLILLCVHDNEGLSQRELIGKMEATTATALSRNLADLSEFTSRKTDGPALVELRSDPMNLRIKRVYLTTKGRRFLRRWRNTMARALTL